MNEKFKIRQPKILLVEGIDDVKFFNSFLKHLGIENFQIIDVEGKSNFKNILKLISQELNSDIAYVIACIRDADSNFDGAFTSIKNSLKEAGFCVPKVANTFNFDEKIKTGIYILPEMNEIGMIEDLCIQTIENKDLECIENYIKCAEKIIKNKAKSVIQIYLATQNPLSNSLGTASEKNIWNFEHDCFLDLKFFLENLR